MTSPAYLQLRNLSLQVEDFSLENLNLEIKQGEYFVILGPTGAGKTILLETIAGIQPVLKGAIHLHGREITHSSPEERRVGFVYQDYALFPHLTVEQNIAFGLRADRRPFPNPLARGSRQESVQEISELLNISSLLQRKPDTLSGGEKQRVAMARALITDPQILLLDEPLSALDPETREKVQIELRRIHERLGTTTLHITHNFDVAVALADRIGVLVNGVMEQIGTPRQIFRQPASEQVARFVGVRNIFRGIHQAAADGSGRFLLDGFELTSLSDLQGSVRASIRPEDILISRDSIESSARNNFRGKVTAISDRGSFSYVTVQLRSAKNSERSLDLVGLITQPAAEELALKIGQEICLAFKASALHIF